MPLIDPQCLSLLLAGAAGRFDVDSLDVCDSTSSELLRRAEAGAPAGSVVVADAQTAGRGRRGRQWLADPEACLMFSLLWRLPTQHLSGLSLAVGVAIAQALEVLGVPGVKLKWPNDVLLERDGETAKLAGILIELATDRRGVQAVIGIGVNLQRPGGELLMPAAGLADVMAELPERHDLLAQLLVSLAGVFDRFAVAGFADLADEWRRRNAWQDRPVVLSQDGQVVGQGVCRGADADGALLVETASGLERFLSGDLSLRPAGEAA